MNLTLPSIAFPPSASAFVAAAQGKQAECLADVDSFVNKFDIHHTDDSVSSEWACRVPGRLTDAEDAVVLHAAMVASQRGDAETCVEAMRILTDRYLKSCTNWVLEEVAEELA